MLSVWSLTGSAYNSKIKFSRHMNCQAKNNTHNPSVVKIKSGELRGLAESIANLNNLLKLAQDPEKLFSDKDSTIIKDSTTTSCLVFKPMGFEGSVFLKRFNVKGYFHILKNIFRNSRGKRVWKTANILIKNHIPTPEPLLFLEEKKSGITFKSYFFSRFLTSTTTLDRYISTTFIQLDAGRQSDIISMAASQIRFMHDNGIYHRDLKAKNILISTQPDNTIKLFFTDLDSAQILKNIAFKKMARDIARLNCSFLDTTVVTKKHRLWFIRQYAGKNNRTYLKKLLPYVLEFTEKKLARSGKTFTA